MGKNKSSGTITFYSQGHHCEALVISLAVTIIGFFVDLTMSAIKRDRGVKDYGELIKWHGGMLDRIDSLCFFAPVFFHIVRYFYV